MSNNTAPSPNRLRSQLDKIESLPAFVRTRARSWVLGRAVPLTGTSGLRYEKMTPSEVVISIANRRKVQNHIGGVHAMASSLAAETATGMIIGMNVRDDCTPVVKDITLRFVKRGQGAMRAVATLTEAQRQLITATDKGEVKVPVTLTDESGGSPIECEFTWAWVPKKRK